MAKRKRTQEQDKPASSLTTTTTTGITSARPDRAPSIEPDLPAPTDEEWLDYKKYKGTAGQFRCGEYIYIRGDTASASSAGHVPDSELFWIGYLKEIRAKDERSVFITVDWMYNTMNQLRSAGVRGLPRRLEANEIYRSYESDRVSVHVVEERCFVTEFDELNPLQKPIGPDDLWYRKEASPKAKSKKPKAGAKKPKIQPGRVVVPIRAPTCFCKKHYTPLPLNEETRMVYCPNTSCRKWYHTRCLLDRSHYKRATSTVLGTLKTSGLQLLQDFAFTLDPLEDADENDAPDVADMDARLQAAAQSSIERGGKETGIVGNGRTVVLARSLLKRWAESSGDDKTLAADLAQWYAHFGWDWVDPENLKQEGEAVATNGSTAGRAGSDGREKLAEGIDAEIEAKANGSAAVSTHGKPKKWVWTCPDCHEAM